MKRHTTQGSIRPTHRSGHGHAGGRAVGAGALIAASFTVMACGSSTGTVTILNTEKIERAIEQSISNQRQKTTHVSCPSGVHQKKDLVFSCTAKFKGDSTRFVVTQQDASGRVHYVAR